MAENKNALTPLPEGGDGTGPGSEHPCDGCLHFYGAYPCNKCCNYIFDRDKRRPCKPGADCTVKRPINGKADLKQRKGTELY